MYSHPVSQRYEFFPESTFEAEQAVSDSADELDMVINLSDAASDLTKPFSGVS